ncbi:MAG: hypothetical protein RML56_03885 [Burkholderiales bacterium]|nr:hypothetical protein [Burkholderiales bacterium]
MNAGRGDAFRRKARFAPECGERRMKQPARAEVRDEGDEIAAVGVEEPERKGVALAAGPLGKAA